MKKNIAAFFDVDGTITKTNVVQYYIWFRQRDMSPLRRALDLALFVPTALRYAVTEKISRHRFVEDFYQSYREVEMDRLREWDRENFERYTVPRIREGAREAVEGHRAEGHRLVILTGGLESRVEPLARHLGIDDVLAVRPETENGRITGGVKGSYLVDQEKERAAREYAAEHDVDLEDSFAYGDSMSDLPLLQAVGHPVAVNPRGKLARIAKERNWEIRNW
jgi:HAD superfamily hydrolase (TIGR01490 family)